MSEFRSGFVTILGLPNVGKSTLINRLVGEKVAIVSPKPQTTRNSTIGIYNDDESQIIFVDTPGVHRVHNKIDEYMSASINNASRDTDVLLLVLSAKKPLLEQYNKLVSKHLSHSAPKIVVINKIDDTTYEEMYPKLAEFSTQCDAKDILPISALKGRNCDILVKIIKGYLPRHATAVRYYPVEQYTDKSERYLAGEIVREKVLTLYDDEIPHGIAADVTKYEVVDKLLNISVDIIVEKESHKAIILGHQGEAIKRLASRARQEMERVFGSKVYLELYVKVKKGWRDNPVYCAEFGYDIKSLKD